MPSWNDLAGRFGRWRRAVRRRLIEPIVMRKDFRETLLKRVAERGHLIYCRVDGAFFFVDPSDRAIGGTLIWHGDYQRGGFETALRILTQVGRLKSNSIFVDAGANIGTHTVYALKSGYFKSAVSFEPESSNVALLEMNVAANGFSSNVTVVQKALGEKAGSATLYLHPRNKGSHAINRLAVVDGLEHVEVQMARLDEALLEAGAPLEQLGLIWIDVEGHEPALARGLGKIAELGVPLVIEFSPPWYAPSDQRSFVELLARHYKVWRMLRRPDGPEMPIGALADTSMPRTDIIVY